MESQKHMGRSAKLPEYMKCAMKWVQHAPQICALVNQHVLEDFIPPRGPVVTSQGPTQAPPEESPSVPLI